MPINRITNIALGFGFTPTLEALIAEVKRLGDSFGARITFIHVGTPEADQKEQFEKLIDEYNFDRNGIKIIYENGSVYQTIDEIAEAEHCNLIVSGALKKEGYRQRYFGSIARNLARKAHLPVMLIPDAHLPLEPVKKIVIGINDDSPRKVIEAGLLFAKYMKGSSVTLVKESALHGSKFSLSQYYTDNDVTNAHEKLVDSELGYLDEILQYFDTESITIQKKVVFGHSGIALVEFANQVQADILIDSFPDFRLGILDRLFPHDVEYALLDLPCKLLLINS